MIAKLAYLTTPGPGRYVLNLQPFGAEDLIQVEIARAHLENIIIDGAALAFRETQYLNRVPAASHTEDADERAEHRA